MIRQATAPLLCAGITTYSPLRHWQAGPGKKVAVAGLGGLGHMAIKLAHTMGADVTMIATSPSKQAGAKQPGADHVVIAKNPDEMARAANSFDLIIDTVDADHAIKAYLDLLKLDGTLVLVGLPEKPLELHAIDLFGLRRSIAGPVIGSIAEMQDMLNLCGKHMIIADSERIRPQYIDHAFERMLASDVKHRFVIDMTFA